MAVENYGGESTHGMSWGTGKARAWVWAEVSNKDDNYCYVRIRGEVQSVSPYGISDYGVIVQVGQDGTNQSDEVGGVFNYSDWVGKADYTYTVARGKDDKEIYCWTKYWGATVDGYGGGPWSGEVGVYVTIPARTRIPHGNPTLSASKTTANYGESVLLSWKKSTTQGNANFARFELWQGNKKLYSGSGISKSVVPSDATGAKGGTAKYTLKEIHEWYGSYPETSTSKSITVRSGVVSAYDSTGKKHTGLVTAYDSSGNSHYVLITAYDSNGQPHSVV